MQVWNIWVFQTEVEQQGGSLYGEPNMETKDYAEN
jgi:hypothetical protein